MGTLETRIAQLERSASKPAAVETELSPEKNRRLLESLRAIAEDWERFARLPAPERLAELLARRPSPPDPAALASGSLAEQIAAQVRVVGMRIWETSVERLRERIAQEAKARVIG